MSWKNILLLLSVIALIHGVVIYGCMQSDSDAVDAAAAKAAEELHNRQLSLFQLRMIRMCRSNSQCKKTLNRGNTVKIRLCRPICLPSPEGRKA